MMTTTTPTVTPYDANGNEAYRCEMPGGTYVAYRDAGWWSAAGPKSFGHRFSMDAAMDHAAFPPALRRAFLVARGPQS